MLLTLSYPPSPSVKHRSDKLLCGPRTDRLDTPTAVGKRAVKATDLPAAVTAGRGGGRPGRHASGDETRLVTFERPVLATVIAAARLVEWMTH